MTVKEQIKNALTMSWAKIKSLCVLNSNVVNSTSGTSTTYPLSAAAGADLQNQINKLNSTLASKNTFIQVSSNIQLDSAYKVGDYIWLNRTGANVYNELGVFDGNGLFTFADDMTALVMASISGRPDNTDNRMWIQLIDYDNNSMIDTSISYGTFNTCNICKVISASKDQRIGLCVYSPFYINKGGFVSSMTIIRLN